MGVFRTIDAHCGLPDIQLLFTSDRRHPTQRGLRRSPCRHEDVESQTGTSMETCCPVMAPAGQVAGLTLWQCELSEAKKRSKTSSSDGIVATTSAWTWSCGNLVGSSMIAGDVGWGCRCMVVIARSASKPQFHLIELMAASHGTLAQEWRPNFVKGAPPSRSATWRLRFRTYGACTVE